MKPINYLTAIILFFISTSAFSAVEKSKSGLFVASLNGAVCNFGSVAEAIDAAQPNDVVHIRGGTHLELLGEISKNLSLVSSRAFAGSGCQFADNSIDVTIDGSGQTFDADGGLVKITDAARVSFNNIDLTNASAINGGIMAILDGSSVTLIESDIYDGSALNSGGNVYVSSDTGSPSRLILSDGSAIFGGTVVTGDGGGVALYDSSLRILEGSIGQSGMNEGNIASNNGGGVYAENSALLINNFNSTVQNNQADNYGGGVFAVGSTFNINNASINNNTAQFSGGGLYLDSTELSVIDATISSNLTTDVDSNAGGGGLYLIGPGNTTIDSTTVSSNTARVIGGGILNIGNETMLSIVNGSDIINNSGVSGGGIFTQSQLLVDSSSIRFNTATGAAGRGGGIRCADCQMITLDAAQLLNNSAVSNGGGVHIISNNQTSIEIIDSTFSANKVTDPGAASGGGVYQEGGTILIDSSDFSNNTATRNGGAIALFDLENTLGAFKIIDSQVSNNSVPSSDLGRGGGALYLDEIFNVQIMGTMISNNYSGLDGGAIYLFDSNLIVEQSEVSRNEAIREGGGIHAVESDLKILNSSISLNTGFDQQNLFPGRIGGGGIKTLNSNLELVNTQVNQNTHNDMGGGIFYDGGIDNTLSISSSYGNLAGQCLPSSLGLDEYCSEVSFNTALLGSGILIKSAGNNNGISLNGLALNQNVSSSFGPLPSNSGAVLQFDLDEFQDTEVTIENMVMVENEGFVNDLPLIQVNGDVTLELLSSTIANNTGKPLNVTNEDSTVILQTSILQQNTAGSLVGNDVSFISLCNNSEQADVGGQSFGANLGDPQFITDARGDYRLAPTSPSLDICSFGSSIDLDGNSRPDSTNNFDQGAFEMNATLFLDLIFANGFE